MNITMLPICSQRLTEFEIVVWDIFLLFWTDLDFEELFH